MNFFPIDKNFLPKLLPEAIIREDWCQNVLHFSIPQKASARENFTPQIMLRNHHQYSLLISSNMI